jgi:amino acid exporter
MGAQISWTAAPGAIATQLDSRLMEQVIHYLPGVLVAYGVVALGILSPGPNVLSVVGTSMGVGRWQGVALAQGIAAGSFVWAVLTWVGLATVLTAYAFILLGIKIAGAFYLLWLAFKAFRSAARSTEVPTQKLEGVDSKPAYFLRGLTIQMTNPKAAFSWIAVMSLGLEAHSPVWVGMAIVVGTTLISTVGHLTYAIVFSTEKMIAGYRRARRWIEAGLGTFFCFASYKLLTSKT